MRSFGRHRVSSASIISELKSNSFLSNLYCFIKFRDHNIIYAINFTAIVVKFTVVIVGDHLPAAEMSKVYCLLPPLLVRKIKASSQYIYDTRGSNFPLVPGIGQVFCKRGTLYRKLDFKWTRQLSITERLAPALRTCVPTELSKLNKVFVFIKQNSC